MNYAVIQSGGKQYIVKPNEPLNTDRIEGKAGDKISFGKVLLVVDGENVEVGSPFLASFKVEAKIIEHRLGEKVRVAKYKSKSRYRKVRGFRADITRVMIESIKESKKGDK